MSHDGDRPPSLRDFLPKKYAPGRNDICPCRSGKKYKRCCGNPVMNQVNGTSREPEPEPTGEPRFLIDVSLKVGPHPGISPLGTTPIPDVSLYIANVRVVHGEDVTRFREMQVKGLIVDVFPVLEGGPIERVTEPDAALNALFAATGKACGDYVKGWKGKE